MPDQTQPTSESLIQAPVTPEAPKSQGQVLFASPKPEAPAEVKPAEVKPAEVKPEGEKPAVVEPPKEGETLLGEEKKPEGEVAPVEYKFDLPADANVNAERLEVFKTSISAMNGGKGLSNEDANALIKFALEDAKTAEKAIQDAWQTTRKEWRTQIEADPEIGGDKLRKEVIPTIRKAMLAYSKTPGEFKELQQQLDVSGMGDHPAFIRMMNGLAKAVSEGGVVRAGGPVGAKQSPAETLFGGSKPN